MRRISREDFPALLLGLAFFGCGGGGRLEECRKILEDFEEITLLEYEDLNDGDLLASPYSCGGLVEEHLGFSKEVCAVKTLERYIGREIDALFPTELGPYNTPVVFAIAKAMGKKGVVDADGAGRAVPMIHHSIPSMMGYGACPLGVCTERGDKIVLEEFEESDIDDLMRFLVERFGNVGVCDHVLSKEQARKSLVWGSISRSLEVGRILLERNLKELLKMTGGEVVAEGTIDTVEINDEKGFTQGRFTVDESVITFKNENMEFRGMVEARFPDLIVVLERDTLKPLENPPRVSENVVVLVARADERWYR